MLTASGHVRLIDFGLAKEILPSNWVVSEDGLAEVSLSLTGSLVYMAPELFSRQMGGRHTDWWALGVLSHEMLTGRSPWSSNAKKVIRREIQTLRIPPPLNLSPQAGLFVCSLLRKEPCHRLGMDKEPVRGAPFFFSVDWARLEKQQLPPAFVPAGFSFRAKDRKRALDSYVMQLSKVNTAAVVNKAEAGLNHDDTRVDFEWNIGLDFVDSHPPISQEEPWDLPDVP